MPLEPILRALGVGAALTATLILILLTAWKRFSYYKEALDRPNSRNKIRIRLEYHGNLRDRYFDALHASLVFIDRQLGPKPWNASSYELALNMAMIYPVVSFLIVWGVTGPNDLHLLPENLTIGQRVAFLAMISLAPTLTYFTTRSTANTSMATQNTRDNTLQRFLVMLAYGTVLGISFKFALNILVYVILPIASVTIILLATISDIDKEVVPVDYNNEGKKICIGAEPIVFFMTIATFVSSLGFYFSFAISDMPNSEIGKTTSTGATISSYISLVSWYFLFLLYFFR
jgi:hypothetical protein